jgi:hypothetical protein
MEREVFQKNENKKAKTLIFSCFGLVLEAGLEPARADAHRILSP